MDATSAAHSASPMFKTTFIAQWQTCCGGFDRMLASTAEAFTYLLPAYFSAVFLQASCGCSSLPMSAIHHSLK
jgi:hypothetical protein